MTMLDIVKVLRINTYIQIEHGTVLLDGKSVICVSLDGTCALNEEDVPDHPLTDAQLEDLFRQTLQKAGGLA